LRSLSSQRDPGVGAQQRGAAALPERVSDARGCQGDDRLKSGRSTGAPTNDQLKSLGLVDEILSL